jgi:uncharacterized protein (DUF2384 family)
MSEQRSTADSATTKASNSDSEATSAPSAASPANHWKRRPRAPALPREQAVRQGEISRLAFLSLGRERAIAFLNGDHETLGGRPLDLATDSEEGATAVVAELERMAKPNGAA